MRNQSEQIENLEQLFKMIETKSRENDRISIGMILSKASRRSFGVIILVAGLLILMPIVGDVPGVPTILGLIIFLTASQLLIGREHFYLPDWILNKTISQTKLLKAVRWLRPTARIVDRMLHRRWRKVIQGVGIYLVAMACVIISAMLPLMEFIPFSANAAGLALTSFGLSLISHDGMLGALAFAMTLSAVVVFIIII